MQQSNIMLSQKHKDGECEISMRYPMCDFDTIKNLKDCQRLFLFQKLDDQSEIIKLTIFEKTQNKVLGNVLYQLERLHIIFKKSLDQQKNTYLNQDNIIVLFLLSIKIEIDFLKFQITRFLLPKAFKTYLSCTEYKMPTQEEYKSLFRKICEDFNINYEQKIRNEIRKQDFYELLQRISTNPITQQNQNKLKQFQESQTTNQAQLNVNLEEQKQEIQYEESILDNLVLNQSQASISNYQKYESLQSQSTQNSSQIDGSESEIRKALNDSSSIIVDNQIKVDSTIAPITKKIILRKITNLPQQIRISKIKHVKSLIKQQNQEIILSKCSDSMIPLGKDNIIFYNQKYDVKLQKQYNKRIQYIGVLDYNYELQETGLFKQIDLKVEYEGQFEYGVYSGLGKQTFLNQRCEGTFRQGQKQGFLTVTNLKSQQILYIQYQYDVQKQYFQDEQTFNQQKQRQTQNEYLIEKEIIESKYLTLSNMTLRTLNVGQWLQEKIIDYYLEEMQNHYKQLHKDQVNYKIFNTGNSQDIFSSNLNYNNFDFDQIQQLISLKNLKQHLESKQISTTTQTTQRNQINRTIFAMNLNRSHFITIAIELSGIYILNSLPSDLVQLCEIFKQAFKQINIDLDYEPEDYQIQIHEQKDYYSCGVQTCYVINQLIKHHNVPIKDIIFNNTTKEIEKYTTHIKNVILTRNSIHINRLLSYKYIISNIDKLNNQFLYESQKMIDLTETYSILNSNLELNTILSTEYIYIYNYINNIKMSSKVNDDGEFSINMQYSISHFTNINNSQKPIKFYLFRKQEEEIQNINDQIFKQTDKSVLRKIMKILMEIYSCMKPGSNYSDDESIIGKFLFNLRIEIDVPQLEISHILLPIAFKKYLTLKNTQYKREQYREVFHIIRRAYAVKQEDLDTQDIELSTYNFYKLLPHISSKTFHSSKKANIKLIQIIQNQNNQYGTLIKSIQNIYKVKYVKSLIKQQNQEIIISKCSNSLLPLGKDNIIYYNQKSDIKLSQTYNKRILYIGQLNYNYELLGEGIFKQIDLNIIYDGQFDQGLQNGEGKQIFLKNQYEGIFNQGQKQGCFIVTKLESQNSYYCQFENDVVAFKIQDKQHFNQLKQQQLLCEKKILEKDIVHVKEYYLSTKIINTLKIGSWLQDGIIDWYLMELKNHYKQLHQDKVNYTLFNVMNSQDVFSSQLNYENFDFTQVEKFINLPFLQKQVVKSKTAQTGTLAKRTIFAMNLNRQHFITIVIDNNQIYFLNSLQSDLSNFGKILKESYLKIGFEIHYHPDNQIQILQQKNFYSCGVHTCYVIHQLIKHYNVPIKDIQFNNTEAKIEKYTIHMRNVIFTKNNIHIEAQTL